MKEMVPGYLLLENRRWLFAPNILTIHRNALIHHGKDPSLTVHCADLFRMTQ
ncbi:MAG: hypothetical protein R2806_09160 [Saprospiraceae bacterium]